MTAKFYGLHTLMIKDELGKVLLLVKGDFPKTSLLHVPHVPFNKLQIPGVKDAWQGPSEPPMEM